MDGRGIKRPRRAAGFPGLLLCCTNFTPPTGNLDSHSTQEIMGILKELYEEGRTVILITHDNEIAAKAKRVIKIKDGHIEADTIEGKEQVPITSQ